MKNAKPYKPRRRRDPRVTEAFWGGVYRALVIGLFAGVGLWGLLLLGGAPLTKTRGAAVVSVLICGLIGAFVVAAWEWGRRALALTAQETVSGFGRRLEFLIWPFVVENEGQDAGQYVEEASGRLAATILAPLVGVPLIIALVSSGKVRGVSRAAVQGFAVLGAALWLLAILASWQWLTGAPAPPAGEQTAQLTSAQAIPADEEARYDSALELALARSRRAKEEGNNARAIAILEQALNDAAVQGRSVAHPELHRNLAWLYAEEGNVDGAIVMFETVLELVPEESDEWREAREALGRLALRSPESLAPVGTKSTLLEDDASQDEGAAETPDDE